MNQQKREGKDTAEPACQGFCAAAFREFGPISAPAWRDGNAIAVPQNAPGRFSTSREDRVSGYPGSFGQLPPYHRGPFGECLQLAEGGVSAKVFHSAIRGRDQLIGSDKP
jgi:hypothetical protein